MLGHKTSPTQILESIRSSEKRNHYKVKFNVNSINYSNKHEEGFSADKFFEIILTSFEKNLYITPFNENLNLSLINSNLQKETHKGIYPRNDTENSNEPITKINFEEKFPDDLCNFLISLCKCVELSDECSSACLVDNTIYFSFNNIKASSQEGNKEMTSIRKLIELILNFDINSVDDYKLLYDHMCMIKDHATLRPHSNQCGFKEHSFHQYFTLLKEFKWNKNVRFESVFEDIRIKRAFSNFAVCFYRVITSSHFGKLKNGVYKMVIVGSGKDEKHAEISLTRFLLKRYNKDKNKINGVFIATSKRPCLHCKNILDFYSKEESKMVFNTRNSSNMIYKNYESHYWPLFLKKSISFEAFVERYKNNELQKTDLNVSTSFEFEEVEENRELEKRVGKLEEENGELKEEIQRLKEENGELKEEIQRLKEENGELKEEIQGLKEENGELKEEIQGLKEEIQRLKDEIQGLKSAVQALIENTKK